ncbi:unnamed protein product [Caenorhabditis angaria]|uniref:Uncharacterized protein n=1 Tax=Caenorhabditis angaria TaxID=860376 RepID=A0A9P1IGQ8_9PELO|nr:unnamed protein product [Caenorhabditis angaria]
MLLTIILLIILTASVFITCKGSRNAKPSKSEDSVRVDMDKNSSHIEKDEHANSWLISENLEKTAEPLSPIAHSKSVQNSPPELELAQTQEDDTIGGGKTLKRLTKSKRSNRSRKAKNEKKRKNENGISLDGTQEIVENCEINEDDDDTFQDAPSLKMNKSGLSLDLGSEKEMEKAKEGKGTKIVQTYLTMSSTEKNTQYLAVSVKENRAKPPSKFVKYATMVSIPAGVALIMGIFMFLLVVTEPEPAKIPPSPPTPPKITTKSLPITTGSTESVTVTTVQKTTTTGKLTTEATTVESTTAKPATTVSTTELTTQTSIETTVSGPSTTIAPILLQPA